MVIGRRTAARELDGVQRREAERAFGRILDSVPRGEQPPGLSRIRRHDDHERRWAVLTAIFSAGASISWTLGFCDLYGELLWGGAEYGALWERLAEERFVYGMMLPVRAAAAACAVEMARSYEAAHNRAAEIETLEVEVRSAYRDQRRGYSDPEYIDRTAAVTARRPAPAWAVAAAAEQPPPNAHGIAVNEATVTYRDPEGVERTVPFAQYMRIEPRFLGSDAALQTNVDAAVAQQAAADAVVTAVRHAVEEQTLAALYGDAVAGAATQGHSPMRRVLERMQRLFPQLPGRHVAEMDFDAERRAAAYRRGRDLLLEWLTPEQRRQFEASGSFEVRGNVTGHRYRIMQPGIFSIRELDDDDGPERARWCFAPDGDLVAGDVMLGQKIALETMEIEALEIANVQLGDGGFLRQWPGRLYLAQLAGRAPRELSPPATFFWDTGRIPMPYDESDHPF